MNFIKTNPHPEGKKTGDCVVRALAIADNKKWIEVYDALCYTGRTIFEMPSGRKTYHQYLLENGWSKQPMPKHQNGKRYTLSQFADENPKGVYVISLANHLATIVNGNLHDIWDCSEKCLRNYWVK